MISRPRPSIFLTVFILLLTGETHAISDPCQNIFLSSLAANAPAEADYDWTTAVYLYGAVKYAQAKHPEYVRKLEPYFDQLTGKIPQIHTPDEAALSLPASFLQTASAKKIVEASRTYFSQEPRNSLGVIDHVGSRGILGKLYPSSVWADSLIMSVLNQLKISNAGTSEGETILKNLKSDSGLYYHAYYPGPGWKFPVNHFWARGNLWVALYLAETGSPDLSGFITTLKKYYFRGKGFHTLIDDSESAFESSATALFGYVLEKADDPDVELRKDIRETLNSFVKDQEFTGVSGPTTAFPYAFYYKALVPSGVYPYGTGAFLLWCSVAE